MRDEIIVIGGGPAGLPGSISSYSTPSGSEGFGASPDFRSPWIEGRSLPRPGRTGAGWKPRRDSRI